MLRSLLLNASLLIAIVTSFNLLYNLRKKSRASFNILMGIVFGVLAIAGMNIPYVYSPGIIYDGRSIIMIVAGFLVDQLVLRLLLQLQQSIEFLWVDMEL